MDLVFQFGFVLREGTNEQLARYIRLGRQSEERALSPQMAQLTREYMDRYESELNDRLTYAGICGKVTRERMDEVHLYKVEDGKESLIATSKVSRDYFPAGAERILHGRWKRESEPDTSVHETGRPGGSEFPGRYDRDHGS